MRELTCITCPLGCRLSVKILQDGEDITVSGNRCPRGADYAKEEVLAPKRVVTVTCRAESGEPKRIPVKTAAPFPKEKIPELIERLYTVTISPPVDIGEVVIADVFGTGIDVVVTRSCG